MATLIQSAQGLSDKVTANKEALEQLQTDLENVNDGVNANTNAIVDLEDRVTLNEEDITQNSAIITGNTTSIDSLTNQTSTNEISISDLLTRVTALEEGLTIKPGETTIQNYMQTPFGVAEPYIFETPPAGHVFVVGQLIADSDLDPLVVAGINKRFNLVNDPIDHTRLPDLRDRVPRGAGSFINLFEYQEDAFQEHKVDMHLGGTLNDYPLVSNTGEGEPVQGLSAADPKLNTRSRVFNSGLFMRATGGEEPRVSQETRVKAFGVNYITRVVNTLENQIFNNSFKATFIVDVTTDTPLMLDSISSEGVVSVKPLITGSPYLFVGFAREPKQAGEVGFVDDAGFTPFALGNTGDAIYLKDDASLSTSKEGAIYYIGTKTNATTLYLADRIFVGESSVPSNQIAIVRLSNTNTINIADLETQIAFNQDSLVGSSGIVEAIGPPSNKQGLGVLRTGLFMGSVKLNLLKSGTGTQGTIKLILKKNGAVSTIEKFKIIEDGTLAITNRFTFFDFLQAGDEITLFLSYGGSGTMEIVTDTDNNSVDVDVTYLK